LRPDRVFFFWRHEMISDENEKTRRNGRVVYEKGSGPGRLNPPVRGTAIRSPLKRPELKIKTKDRRSRADAPLPICSHGMGRKTALLSPSCVSQ
jgi:hypothetical protein